MSIQYGNSAPGLRTERVFQPRDIMITGTNVEDIPHGCAIDGSKTRDPNNAGWTHIVQSGKVFGRITSSGLWAPSILGLTVAALTTTATLISVSPATATEINRRIGSTGSAVLVSSPTTTGTVALTTFSFTAVDTTNGVLTITAALPANEVQVVQIGGTTTAGTFRVGIYNPFSLEADDVLWTTAVAYNASLSTLNTALAAALATATTATGGTVTATGTLGGGASQILTFTYTGSFVGVDISPVKLDLTALTGATNYVFQTVTKGTQLANLSGTFGVSGSLLVAADGSGQPLGILNSGDPIRVTDVDGNNLTVQTGRMLVGGFVDGTKILDIPSTSNTSLRNWLKNALNSPATGAGPIKFYENFVS
jgi:hypothetical protein